MQPLDVVRRWLGITPYRPRVACALVRRKTTDGARSVNGQHGPYAPPGLTLQQQRALVRLEQEQRAIRAALTDLARRRHG